jgi:tetratricopeptide (TPR) repeat protein
MSGDIPIQKSVAPRPDLGSTDPPLEAGRVARDNGYLTVALAHFQRAAAQDPSNSLAHLELGRTLVLLGLPWSAEPHLERALELEPDRLDAILEHARWEALVGDRQDALAQFLRVLEAHPGYVPAYLGAADLLIDSGRFDDASALVTPSLLEASDTHPGRAWIFQKRALTSLGLQRSAEATGLLGQALTATGQMWPLSAVISFLAARGEIDVLEEIVEGLRPVALESLDDWVSYQRNLDALPRVRRFLSVLDDRAKFDEFEILQVAPRNPELAQPPVELARAITAPHAAAYFQLNYLLPPERGLELPPDVAELIQDDIDATSSWPQLRQVERPHFTYLLHHCFLFDGFDLGGSAAIFDDHYFIPSLVAPLSIVNLSRKVFRARSHRHVTIDEAFVLPDAGTLWRNYYHAIVDILSALSIYHALDLACPVVVPHPGRSLHYEAIRASGVDVDRIVTAGQVAGFLVGRAYCPQPAGGQLGRTWWKSVAHRLTEGVRTGRASVLYLSRGQSASRQLVNERELEEALSSRFDAKIVHAENLSFEAQVRLAAEAPVIVAPHGAGLTNIIFAQSGTSVVELLPDRYLVQVFRDLSAVSGHRYVPIVGTVEDLATMEWRVEVEKVLRVVAGILDSN